MAKIDPEQERRRLAEFYSHQMDGELEEVASQAHELTDLAREALQAEMSRRGLATKLAECPVVTSASVPVPNDPLKPEPEGTKEFSLPDGQVEAHTMVTIRQIRDLPEALLAQGSLGSAGIECVLADDNMVRMDWLWSNGIGGVKLAVAPKDVEAAEAILNQPIPEEFDVAGVGEYLQPQCPNCQSLDVNFQELAPAAYLSIWVNVPIPFHRRAWRCHSCDAEWEDDGVPGTTQSPA